MHGVFLLRLMVHHCGIKVIAFHHLTKILLNHHPYSMKSNPLLRDVVNQSTFSVVDLQENQITCDTLKQNKIWKSCVH
jgi:hypothetical protein